MSSYVSNDKKKQLITKWLLHLEWYYYPLKNLTKEIILLEQEDDALSGNFSHFSDDVHCWVCGPIIIFDTDNTALSYLDYKLLTDPELKISFQNKSIKLEDDIGLQYWFYEERNYGLKDYIKTQQTLIKKNTNPVLTKKIFLSFAEKWLDIKKESLETIKKWDSYTFNSFLNSCIPDFSKTSIDEAITKFTTKIEENKKKITEYYKTIEETISNKTLFVAKNFINCIGEDYFLSTSGLNVIRKKVINSNFWTNIEKYEDDWEWTEEWLGDIFYPPKTEKEKVIFEQNNSLQEYIKNYIEILKDIIEKQKLPTFYIYGEDTEDEIYESIYYITRYNIAKYFSDKITKQFNIKLNDTLEIIINEKFNEGITHKNIIELAYWAIKNIDFLLTLEEATEIVNNTIKTRKTNAIKNKLLSQAESNNKISIDDIDLMTGVEFENFVCSIFEKMGYTPKTTPITGDQGIDVIAEKNGKKIGIQCKRYTDKITNKAIQEAVSGKAYYGLDKIMVITNSRFTQSAKDLANANNVVLWDRDFLIEKLKEI